MRAAVLVEPGRFELRDVPRPEPGPDEALIRIARTGICGTDLHIFNGHYAAEANLPMIPGHEFTGHIEALGGPAPGLETGMPVVVDMNIGCTRCYWCRRNEILNCPEMQQIGDHHRRRLCGVHRCPVAARDPGACGDAVATVLALTEPLACVVRAARKAQVSFGQSVVVIGAGPIGNLHVQLLRTIGAAPIIVSDISGPRVAMALESGADFGTSDPGALHRLVMEKTGGRGADIVIESVGHPKLYEAAQGLMRKGGHLAAFGLTGADEVPLSRYPPDDPRGDLRQGLGRGHGARHARRADAPDPRPDPDGAFHGCVLSARGDPGRL